MVYSLKYRRRCGQAVDSSITDQPPATSRRER